jgi:pimeloyl-ACP methyl ester carboxylesterase
MFSPFDLDCVLHSRSQPKAAGDGFSFVSSPYGRVRVFDSGGGGPVLLMVPDGPCFIEHFDTLIEAARKEWRVIVFDMPGFGRSFPRNGYRHSFEQACEVIEQVFDALGLNSATLAFSCANGFYALCFAKKHPAKVNQLISGALDLGGAGFQPQEYRPRVSVVPGAAGDHGSLG